MIDKSNFTLDFRYALAIPLKARGEMTRHYKHEEYVNDYIYNHTKTRGSKGAEQLINIWLDWANRLTITQTLNIDDINNLISSLNRRKIKTCNVIYAKIDKKLRQSMRTKAISMIGPGREIVVQISAHFYRNVIANKFNSNNTLKFYYRLRERASVILKPR